MVLCNSTTLAYITNMRDVSYDDTQLSANWTIDASAEYLIDISMIHDVFTFSTTVTDLSSASSVFLTANDASQYTNYYVNANMWDASNAIVNPYHALMKGGRIGGQEAVLYAGNKSLVKHDFMRYIAQSLFNTHKGLDLITNEVSIRETLANIGHVSYHCGMLKVLEDASMVNPQTNADTTHKNLSRAFVETLYNAEPERFAGLNDGQIHSIPFQINDYIAFKVKCTPAVNQEQLTNLSSPIPPRVYQIQLKIKAKSSVNNVQPTDSLTTELQNSYVKHP